MFVEVDVVGCSTIPSQGGEVSYHMLQMVTDSDKDDGDYVVSNSFFEKTYDEEDVVNDDSSNTNDETTFIESSELI